MKSGFDEQLPKNEFHVKKMLKVKKVKCVCPGFGIGRVGEEK